MKGAAVWGWLKSTVGALLAVIVFPIAWMRMLRLARRHKADDPRAVAKVAAGIVVALLVAGGLGYEFNKFQHGATRGIYTSMDKRLSAAVGEGEYGDNVATVAASDVAIPIIQRNLANATAANDTAKMTDLSKALNDTTKARDTAAGKVATLTPNHQLYLSLQPDVVAQDDAAIRSKVAAAAPGLGGTYQAHAVADSNTALALKDKYLHDMHNDMWYFLWPSLAGAFFAPLVFAAGSVVNAAYVESDTVGFKRYPSGAAGFFLLFGAFGLPSIPFAAWALHDLEKRSVEGQIAL